MSEVQSDVFLCIQSPGIPQQHQIPYSNAEAALAALQTAMTTGIYHCDMPDGVSLYLQTGPGTVYLIIPKRHFESRVLQARLEQLGSLPLKPSMR